MEETSKKYKKMFIWCLSMTTKKTKSLREIKNSYEPIEISSEDKSEEIRKYFIDRMIQMIEYMSAKVFSGNVRNKDAENVRINQMKAVINACNVGNRILKDFEYDKILDEVYELKKAVLYDKDGEEVIEIATEKFDAIDDLDSKIAKLEENEWSK